MGMYDIDIPSDALNVMKRFEKAGYEAYVVGGCVRDSILGRKPHDWDICTDAKPDEMMKVFAGSRVVPTGIQHGTVTVMPTHGSDGYEVTTFRTDGRYADGRHPNDVSFIKDVREDLARRDFTINAMAYSPRTGLVDPFHGADDLKNGRIRCVGNPYDRFSEDALRIMRAIRFAANFGMEIDRTTGEAADSLAGNLVYVSKERITSELLKMFETAEQPGRILYAHQPIVSAFIPEIVICMGYNQQTPWHEFDLFRHIVETVDAVDMDRFQGKELQTIRMAALLHDIGKPDMFCWDDMENVAHFKGHDIKSAEIAAEVLAHDFRLTANMRDTVVTLVARHEQRRENMPGAKKILNQIGHETARLLFGLQRADVIAHGELSEWRMGELRDELVQIDETERQTDAIIATGEAVTVKDLACNGHDLIAAGLKPSPMFGMVMDKLLEEVMDGTIENDRALLVNEAVILYHQMDNPQVSDAILDCDAKHDMDISADGNFIYDDCELNVL